MLNENRLCDWGCGNKATHYFKYSKKFCCGSNVSKCPAKNKKAVDTRRSNNSYITGAAAGLETKRTTVLADGKTILEKAAEKFKKTITTADDAGITIALRRAKKMVETRRSIIDPVSGLD